MALVRRPGLRFAAPRKTQFQSPNAFFALLIRVNWKSADVW